MRFFNTQTQSVDAFQPIGNHVGLYVCGVTPYDTTHAGHAFTFLTYDVLVRFLRFRKIDVTYVQNVTDVDDDVIRKARELNMAWDDLAARETRLYLEDMANLNALPFDHYVAATDHIPEMRDIVVKLIDANVAYESNGSVYFSVAADPEFGKLSHLAAEEMLPVANERGNFPDDPNKQAPIDFVLWQAASPGEPTWDSPWGPGRPGWHIECSAMSMKYLGKTVDIHGGGYDLIFPHHECEIAQSENATGQQPFVRTWMHVAMVDYQGEKMSKSLGNLVLARNVLKNYSPDAFRLYLHSNHYRTQWEFMDVDLEKWAAVARDLAAVVDLPASGAGEALDVNFHRDRFIAALEDDLNTPAAIRELKSIATSILQASETGDVRTAQSTLKELAGVLGLSLAAAS